LSVSEPDELPSGIVTFVLTDIEGSTSLFRRLGDAYSRLLQQHHRLLSASFSAWRGAELGTEGDSFLVAFADAPSAVRACVDVQRSVGEHLSGPPAAIRVRIGVHTGPATPVGREYVSLSIHQTARISAAAHGGQVLLSDVTAAAVGECLREDSIRIEDLGLYQLRDFPEPQRLFQVDGPGMQSQFPPLRTLSVLAHNLPFMSTRFVGREEERSSLRSVLHDSRLVTIVGPGGVGKTRLAIETGHEALNQFADGVWLVDLAAVTEPQHLTQAIASALGVTPRTGAATASVADALRPKHALLILDNCEHLVDAVASLVEELLGQCPHLRILATSREALNLEGESARQLRPMSLPPLHSKHAAMESDALQLFLDRAAQAGAELDGHSEVVAQVADIVTRLDGLPLAIELAAATLQHLGLEELRLRLAARFELLSRGRRTAPARHRVWRRLMHTTTGTSPSPAPVCWAASSSRSGTSKRRAATCGICPVG
jgi:class 3 adenylate cyclase